MRPAITIDGGFFLACYNQGAFILVYTQSRCQRPLAGPFFVYNIGAGIVRQLKKERKMVAATAVTVAQIGTGDDAIPAGNAQEVFSNLHGKVKYAADTAAAGQGTADWSAQKVSALHYHLNLIAIEVGYSLPPLEDL